MTIPLPDPNQAPPLVDIDLYRGDVPLVEAVSAAIGPDHPLHDELSAFGRLVGTAEMAEHAHLANRSTPELRTHDRTGERIDQVTFHPSWHRLMATSIAHGLHAAPWDASEDPHAHLARAVRFFLMGRVESGHGCPISMTYAVVPALRHQPDVAERWLPTVFSRAYDPRDVPVTAKTGALFGMGMTERQGGSDVRTNATRATPVGDAGPGHPYTLVGHKWFMSAPMCDAFLVLAQADGGLSCFLVPRWTPDGDRNRLHLQRLKDKLGNRSNASAEVEFHGAWGRLVGEEGEGLHVILEMVNHTRLDCVIGSAALMREAVAQATHHVRHRRAFGKPLVEQPLMRRVIADLALEVEAATALMVRLAEAFDRDDEQAAAFRRVMTPIAKYWVCKRTPHVVAEALECLGGNGYVEEFVLPRLFRESPLNSIWEGSGNVIALDVLRALRRQPETRDVLRVELETGRGLDGRIDNEIDDVLSTLDHDVDPAMARRFVERAATTLQAILLARRGHPEVADAFLASRLDGRWGRAFGTLPAVVRDARLVERAVPGT